MAGIEADQSARNQDSGQQGQGGQQRAPEGAEGGDEERGHQAQGEEGKLGHVALDDIAVVDGVDRDPGHAGLHPFLFQLGAGQDAAHPVDQRRDGVGPRLRIGGLHKNQEQVALFRGQVGIGPHIAQHRGVVGDAVDDRAHAGQSAKLRAQLIHRGLQGGFVRAFKGHHQHVGRTELAGKIEEAFNLRQLLIDQVQVRGVDGQMHQRGAGQAQREQQQGQHGAGPVDGEGGEEGE